MRTTLVLLVTLAACGSSDPPCDPAEPCRDGDCATSVRAGVEHTCAIREDRTAWCWGRNDTGQLGDGTTTDRAEPVRVMVPRPLVAIAPGASHTCALDDNSAVWCWGSDRFGQVAGKGAGRDVESPVEVGLTATALTAGTAHTCALDDQGAVRCWGTNILGQLGLNDVAAHTSAEVVRGVGAVTEISASNDMTCAIDRDGALWCWGFNRASNHYTSLSVHPWPTRVEFGFPLDADPFVHVAAGELSVCASTAGGQVNCVGSNSSGQTGGGRPFGPTGIPIAVETVAGGASFACAIERLAPDHDQQRVWCWGRDENTQLADGLRESHSMPVLTEYANALEVTGGGNHLCALSTVEGITCSGDNRRGQLGDGMPTTQSRPTPPIAGLTGATAIAAGLGNSCAIAGDDVLCWGANGSGQLGDGAAGSRSTPTKVEGLSDASGARGALAIALGDDHVCAVLRDRTVACWGSNRDWQLGEAFAPDRSVPTPVPGVRNVVQLAAGWGHNCALIDNGGTTSVTCWGKNDEGQCGTGTSGDLATPTVIAGLTGIKEVAAGGQHSCALLDGGTVACWGGNFAGELGDGSFNSPSLTPVPVGNLNGVAHLVSHGEFTCALRTAGDVICWGAAESGQIGDGVTSLGRRTPPADPVRRLAGVTQLALGNNHACAVSSTGLSCWGASYDGQAGSGTYGPLYVPAPVALPGTVKQLAGGGGHTCALLADGTVSCWGNGRSGQLGNGTIIQRVRVAPRLSCRR